MNYQKMPFGKYKGEDIKSVFRALSKKYHPDMGGNETAMRAIIEFKQLLTK